MGEQMRWEAVYGDGQRRGIEITGDVKGEWREDRFTTMAVIGVLTHGPTPIVTAHRAVEVLLLAGHDVRDLVPEGAASRADLRADVERLKAELYLAVQSAEKHMLRANAFEMERNQREAELIELNKMRESVRLLLKWAQDGGE